MSQGFCTAGSEFRRSFCESLLVTKVIALIGRVS